LRTCRDTWRWPAGAWPVHDDSLHLTLHFLGNVATEQIPALCLALHVPFQAFTLTIDQTQVWSNGVASLCPTDIPPSLRDLHAALGHALRQFGLPVETRPYKPHITLARRAHGVLPPAQIPPVHWNVQHYALMASELEPGRRYRLLRRYPSDT
jgi:RNA 2',3'-cyclic 3'-phosphodiesterase